MEEPDTEMEEPDTEGETGRGGAPAGGGCMRHQSVSRDRGNLTGRFGDAVAAASRPPRPHWLPRRRLIPRLAAAAALGWALLGLRTAYLQAATGAARDPEAVVKGTLDQALGILRQRNVALTARRRELHDLAAKHLDFADMARSALGYHWGELSPEQRRRIVPLFSAFMEDSYLDKIQDYAVLRVRYLRQTYLAPDSAKVDTKVIQEGEKEPISLNFYLRREPGGWKVYDVEIDSIRIVANYRNQFDRVINDGGFETLMARLRQKQAELASLLGK